MNTTTQTSYHPVIKLPADCPVLDFSDIPDRNSIKLPPFGIGRYNEKRLNVYTAPLYGGIRNIHVGIDIFAPVGTPVHSFDDGMVFMFGNNNQPDDYGYTIITKHTVQNRDIFALYGHLSKRSLENKKTGELIKAGQIIAWIGDQSENGGWLPHLHFQLSFEKPEKPDIPGVVSAEQLSEALLKYPDPRIVLGPIY